MRKIPTLYQRDEQDRRYVTDEVTPGCEWVLEGEGVPTRKFDGTCVRLDEDGAWWARREVKPGKAEPAGFVAIEHDETTGKTVGWEPIEQSPFARFHAEALSHGTLASASSGFPVKIEPGTYELIGPKINGNPENVIEHRLIRHGCEPIRLLAPPQELVEYVGHHGWEGLVWHHPDGRMAKLKVRDLR